MIWALSLVVIAILGAAAIVGTGRWGDMPELVDDRPRPVLPEGELTARDLRQARFAVVTRGYSPVQVDALLARLAEQMAATHPDHEGSALSKSEPTAATQRGVSLPDAE